MSETPSTVLCDRCNATFLPPYTFSSAHTLANLRTNYHPTSSETLSIDNSILELENSLTRCNQEITRLGEVVRSLEEKRTELRIHIDRLSSLKAPIRRLPTELLVDIFYIVVHDTWDRDSFWQWGAFQGSAWHFGQVGTRWRNLALASKGLWSFICVSLDFIPEPCELEEAEIEEELSRVLHLVTAYMQRSDPLPLSICLMGGEEGEGENPLFQPILELFTTECHRWREAKLLFWPIFFDPYSWFLPLIGDDLPLLEKLTTDSGGHTIDHTQFSKRCPKLCDLTISWGVAIPSLPYFQLSALRMENIWVETILQILSSCPYLESLVVEDPWDDTNEIHPDVVISPYLRTLLVSFTGSSPQKDDERALSRIFNILNLPSLLDFTMVSKYEQHTGSAWPLLFLVAFVQRSSCLLKTIAFERIPMSDQDLIQILLSVPTLTTLKIDEIPTHPLVTNHFLQSLTYSPGTASDETDKPLVPRLTHLELTVEPHFDDAVLLKMVESRWSPASLHSFGTGGPACLEFLRLKLRKRELGAQCLSRLQEMRSEGLRLVLH